MAERPVTGQQPQKRLRAGEAEQEGGQRNCRSLGEEGNHGKTEGTGLPVQIG